MKIRNGFVSNSSTSSFICAICGGVEAGQDIGLRDCKMFECINGHISHINCCKMSEEDQEKMDKENNGNYEVSAELCPMCQLKAISRKEEIKYLRYVYGKTNEELLEEIKTKFGTYEKFKEFLKELNKKVLI